MARQGVPATAVAAWAIFESNSSLPSDGAQIPIRYILVEFSENWWALPLFYAGTAGSHVDGPCQRGSGGATVAAAGPRRLSAWRRGAHRAISRETVARKKDLTLVSVRVRV